VAVVLIGQLQGRNEHLISGDSRGVERAVHQLTGALEFDRIEFRLMDQ